MSYYLIHHMGMVALLFTPKWLTHGWMFITPRMVSWVLTQPHLRSHTTTHTHIRIYCIYIYNIHYVYTHTYIYICIYIWYMYMVHICIDKYVYIYICIHTHTHIYIWICTYPPAIEHGSRFFLPIYCCFSCIKPSILWLEISERPAMFDDTGGYVTYLYTNFKSH